jgi:hypothetical protein
MRLLQLDNYGNFSPTKDVINEVPLYAILFHTLGEENEEISYGDLIRDSGESKIGTAGYKKIKFCSDQSARDGLRYIWVERKYSFRVFTSTSIAPVASKID